MIPVILNGHEYLVPALDEEDIVDWNFLSIKRYGPSIRKVRDIVDIRSTKLLSRMISKIAELFFDRVLTDMIENNAVFLMPQCYSYMVIAQQSPKSKRHRINPVTGQAKVMAYLVFTKRGFGYALGKTKFISLSEKYKNMIKDEISNGHIYPVIDDIIDKMTYYEY